MSIRYLMGFNTTDLPVNFNDRFRKIFKTGIFWGGDVVVGSDFLSVDVSPFVATTCDGGVVRDDVDTQHLVVPANRPDGVYICLLAKYRDFDNPQIEWKVVEPSCLTTCENADCFIIFALVKTGPGYIVSVEKWGPQRLDQCNKEDLHTYATVYDLPAWSAGLVRGECAFVIETGKFYWWTGTPGSSTGEWRPINCGGRTIVIVSITGDTVNIDASAGDIFICNLTGPTTFAAPTNSVEGKLIEYRIYSQAYYALTWNSVFMGTQATIPLITSGNGLAPNLPDRVVFECVSSTEWLATFRDTNNIAIGNGAQAPEGTGNVVIGVHATTGASTNSAIVLGSGSVGASAWNSIAIGGEVGDTAYTSLALCSASVQSGASASIAVGVGATVYTGAYSSIVIGGGSDAASPNSLILGRYNSISTTGTADYNSIIGSGNTIASANISNSFVVGTDNSIDTGASDCFLIGNENSANTSAGNNFLLGVYNRATTGASHNFLGGEYSSVRGSASYTVVLGLGTGTEFDGSSSNPPGDRCEVMNSSVRDVAIGSKVLVESSSSYSTAIGYNLWLTSGSTSTVAIGRTILLETGSAGSICLGGYGSQAPGVPEQLQYGSAYAHNRISSSVNCVAIGTGIEIVDMGADITLPGTYDSSSIAIGRGVQLQGKATGYSGSNTAIGFDIGFTHASFSIGIGQKVRVGSSTNNVAQAIAIGSGAAESGAVVYAHQAIAIGAGTIIAESTAIPTASQSAIAIGTNATIATGCSEAIAIGARAHAETGNAHNAIAIGSDTHVTGHAGIAIGTNTRAGGNQCVIGQTTTGAPDDYSLTSFTVNTVVENPSGSPTLTTMVAFQISYESDSDPPAVVGVAHKTDILLRVNGLGASSFKRVHAWAGGDVSTLAASYPSARVLFLKD